jgi:membrane associated rhomboid family serine protease
MSPDLVRKHFDKLLLVCLFLFMLLFTLIAVTAGVLMQGKVDQSNVAWCRETAGTILGALIGLISGMSLRGGDPIPDQPSEAAGENAPFRPL